MKEKIVYNLDTGATEVLKFLRMNNIHNYNFTIGNVDIVDQLRGSYRVYHWLCNSKWWWLIVFLIIGVFIKNLCVLYFNTFDEQGIPKQGRLTHLELMK